MTTESGYLLDNRQVEAGERFAAMSRIFDPVTFRHFDALGVRDGWRAWEVGAGGTPVVEWLARRVGARGRVLATDIDVSLVASAAGDNVEVRRHDVGVDAAPGEGFDLVHARLVLVHVPARERALRTMIDALRPGGVLLVEDADPALQPLACPDVAGPDEELANRIRRGFRSLLERRGVDLAYGRKLPRLLRHAGLVDVGADAYFPITLPESGVLEAATVRQVRGALVEQGLATDDEIATHLSNIAAGRLDVVTAPMISAWGHKT
ncbi:MAG TPA: methyltransferase domain-containing protein [Polyangiaceae bacterium]|nr:methyltransferase domain-containing protein [Polyangiaceae bacterium]